MGFGRRTISGLLCTQSRHQQDWTADYRLYGRGRFSEEDVFNVVRKKIEALSDPAAPLVVAMDDSLLRKCGRKIHGVRYLRDPLSPPFNVNLVRGLRVLQVSAALPDGKGAARMIPIDFTHAVLPQKPPKNASDAELDAYKKERALRNINKLATQRLARLRQQMDESGSHDRTLIVGVDGRLTNSTVFKSLPERTVLIGRLRKDAVLHYPPEAQLPKGRKRKYGKEAPAPQELLKDDSVPWEEVCGYACGQVHKFNVKRIGPVLMRMDGAAHPVQIMVIKPLGYRLTLGGRLLYRQPAFLVCRNPSLPAGQLLQDYLWRWDIELNFRDEKTLLGVGQAQVRTKQSTQKAPALGVAGYSLLLLAAADAYGVTGVPNRDQQPQWRKHRSERRATTSELISQLRIELWASALQPKHFSDFTNSASPHMKSKKIEFNPASAMFLAIA